MGRSGGSRSAYGFRHSYEHVPQRDTNVGTGTLAETSSTRFQRDAQRGGSLSRGALGSLERASDLSRRGLLTRERLQFANIVLGPISPLSLLHHALLLL